MGEWTYRPTFSSPRRVLELHAAASLPTGKKPLVPIGQEAGWAPESVWTTWRSEDSCPLGRPAYSQRYPGSSTYHLYTYILLSQMQL
jgi:hypothetical protein